MLQVSPTLLLHSVRPLNFLLCILSLLTAATAQSDGTNVRFTQGEVNEGATVSLSVPIASFPGRGMNLPVSLSYSSSVWRIDHKKSVRNFIVPPPPYYVKQSVTEAIFAERSKAGWRSSLDLPVVEWPKQDEIYDYKGRPAACCWNYRMARVTIHMPDGSSHELRKSDQFYISPEVDVVGRFYAVDGSRIRYDSTGVTTGTLFLPDGTKYILGDTISHVEDRHGNRQTYNAGTRQWVDTLGRMISHPIPSNPEPQDYSYSVPRVGGGNQTYIFKWRRLADARSPGSAPLHYVASHYLPNPSMPPTDSSGANFPQPQSSQPSLFKSVFVPPEDESNPPPYPVPVLVVGKGQTAGQVFDPVVLAEIVLPDNNSYKFEYNVHGEIEKVAYPAGAYEQYGYDPMISDLDQQKQPYVQATRKVKSRKVSVNGIGTDIAEWRYSQVHSADTRKTLISAPDNTRTEILKWDFAEPVDDSGKRYWPFGQSPSQNGMVYETRAYSTSADGLGGSILRRELTQYEESVFTYTYTAPGINPPFTKSVSAFRNARPDKKVSIVFEGGGPALGQASTYEYDKSFEFSTGVDQASAKTYHYAVVSNSPINGSGATLAKDGAIHEIPVGPLATTAASTYRHDSVYRDQNILGIAMAAELRDTTGTIVSRSEMLYDECPQYCVASGSALPTSLRTWDSTKGVSTNAAAYLSTHAKFDQYGNRIQAIDAKGHITTTVYDSQYQAFPVQVISGAPDPTGVQGSSAGFTTSTTYDLVTGHVLSTTDVNGLTTRKEYNDLLQRPTRVIAPNGHQTVTEYGAGSSESTRWVRVRTQIDNEKWSEAVSKYDGLGRTYLSEKIDANGNVLTETEYDTLGRVARSTNPYRAGETKQWTTPEYDDLNRTRKVTSPDSANVQITYGLSTDAILGTTKTITDQAGRKRTGITDALGNMIRVYEGPVSQNLATDYVFDTLGNLRQTIQGEQSRYFMHDSLGRMLFSKQPEQQTNAAFVATDPVTGNFAWSTKYTYDDNGNILTTTDARNISITGTYDSFGRILVRDYSDATPDVRFFYDGTGLGSIPNYSKGKTTKISSTVSESRNTSFDNMGRLLSSEQRTTSEQQAGIHAPYTFNYVYNLSGFLIEETYPSGRVVRNTLNTDGELSQVQSKKNPTHGFFTYADAFEYSASGAILKTQLGNGHWETAEYDSKRLQVTMLGLGLTAADQNLLRLEFSYNSDGQNDNNGAMRLQRVKVPSIGNNPAFNAVQSYFYDPLNRLASAVETVAGNQTWKQTFSYDRYGNRRFDSSGTTTLGTCQQSICNPTISTANNRFATGQNYLYDAAGSITRDAAGQRFTHDAEGRQKEFFAAQNQTASPDATYHYDGEGRRVKKIVGTEVTVFVYDGGGQLAGEYSTSVTPVQQAKVAYLTADHLGSPRVITDQNGRVSSRKDFAAFGDEIVTPQRVPGPAGNGYDPPNIRQDYTGYQDDIESGLEFAQARYYNTAHGRFTSVDPLTASATIRNPQTFNRYSYALNSPYKFTDPLGLCPGPDGKITTQPCEITTRVAPQDAVLRGEIVTPDNIVLAPNVEFTLPAELQNELTLVGQDVEATTVAFEQDREAALEYGAASLNHLDGLEWGSEIAGALTSGMALPAGLPLVDDNLVAIISDTDPNELAHAYVDSQGMLNLPSTVSVGGTVSVSIGGLGGGMSIGNRSYDLGTAAADLQANSNNLNGELNRLTAHETSMNFAEAHASTPVNFQAIRADGSREGPVRTTTLTKQYLFSLHRDRINAGREAARSRRTP